MRRHRAAPPPKTPSTPRLVLAAFQSPATIDFGEQHPDKEAVKTLVLSCPADAKKSATVEVVRTPTKMDWAQWRGSIALSFVGTVTGTFPVLMIRRQGGVRNFQDEKDADSAVEAWASTEGSLAYRGVDMEKNESATFFSIFVLTSKCLFLTKLNIALCKNVDADVALLVPS